MKEKGSQVESFKTSRLGKILTLPLFMVCLLVRVGFKSCFDLVLFWV